MDEHASESAWVGTADLISETAFASNYASLWRTLTPLMDHFVRRMNLDGYERDFIPLKTTSDAEQRGIINDAATRLYGRAVAKAKVGEKASNDDLDACILEAALYVRGKDPDVEPVSLGREERKEVLELSKRIERWFATEIKSIKQITVSPRFLGSGIIAACNGDFSTPHAIIEIKAGDRMFRSADYRQVAIYVALKFAETRKVFKKLVLVNPRVGVSVSISTDSFAREVAGQSSIELCTALLAEFGGALVSP